MHVGVTQEIQSGGIRPHSIRFARFVCVIRTLRCVSSDCLTGNSSHVPLESAERSTEEDLWRVT